MQRQARRRPPLQPADGQIGQGVEYLRCSSISLPRAVVPIVDMVSSSLTTPPHSALIHSYSIVSCSSSSDLSRPASCLGAFGLLSGPSPPSWTTRSPRRLPQRQARRRPPPQPVDGRIGQESGICAVLPSHPSPRAIVHHLVRSLPIVDIVVYVVCHVVHTPSCVGGSVFVY